MCLLEQYLVEERALLMRQRVKVSMIGRREGLPAPTLDALDRTVSRVAIAGGTVDQLDQRVVLDLAHPPLLRLAYPSVAEAEADIRATIDGSVPLEPYQLISQYTLEPLLKDPNISDILVNTHKHVFIEKHGKLVETPIRFKDDKHLLHVIDHVGHAQVRGRVLTQHLAEEAGVEVVGVINAGRRLAHGHRCAALAGEFSRQKEVLRVGIGRLAAPALLIADSHGIQFLIRDQKALDKHSRKILDRFL